MALGEAGARFVREQGAMVKLGQGKVEGAVEQYLARGGFEQVLAADDFGDAHGRIIHHHRKLVGGNVIVPPHHKVAKVPPGDQLLGTVLAVHEGNHLPIRHSKPPVGSSP